MSTEPTPGTAKWHLRQAGIWLAAATSIWDNDTPVAEKAGSVSAMAAMAQAHATLGAAIEAHPTVSSVWVKPE